MQNFEKRRMTAWLSGVEGSERGSKRGTVRKGKALKQHWKGWEKGKLPKEAGKGNEANAVRHTLQGNGCKRRQALFSGIAYGDG